MEENIQNRLRLIEELEEFVGNYKLGLYNKVLYYRLSIANWSVERALL